MNISIVVPVFNQLHFTKICLESLMATLHGETEIVVIDNGSSDGTSEYLSAYSNIIKITNSANLGCAAAWNQGVAASHSPWIAILNNDIILTVNWLEGLLDFAEEKAAAIVSPAFREGEFNYDIAEYSKNYVRRMHSVSRMGIAHGICFLVKREVFDAIGLFDENFRIGQFEDADFFRRARFAGFIIGITGRSFIHHFGSITQDTVRKEKTVGAYEKENRIYYRTKHDITLWQRVLARRRTKLQNLWWRLSERALYRHTLMEKWLDDRLHYF